MGKMTVLDLEGKFFFSVKIGVNWSNVGTGGPFYFVLVFSLEH